MGADKTLVDTSAWIQYLNLPDFPQGHAIRKWLERGHAHTTGLIVAELIQGARNERDLEAIDIIAETAVVLEPTTTTWMTAGRLSRDLRKKGLTIPLQDCLLAVLAVDHGLKLFTLDRHFTLINKHYPLHMTDH